MLNFYLLSYLENNLFKKLNKNAIVYLYAWYDTIELQLSELSWVYQ